MKLEDIGFYTLSDQRARMVSASSPLQRCELILTSKCNFRCPYCRHVGGSNMKFKDAVKIVKLWADQGLQNIRFSGGEPTLYSGLLELVCIARDRGINRIAISTNGSANLSVYNNLIVVGVNDFSISLDACCSSTGDSLSGIEGSWEQVVHNIRWISERVYTTVGVVLTDVTRCSVNEIILYAHDLGVADIRIIPAAQSGNMCGKVNVPKEILDKHPILRYRVKNLKKGKPFRGIQETDSHRCALVLDDMAVSHGKHYPCIIYMREYGKNIGHINKHMRADRLYWYQTTDTHKDMICKNNCLDVCRDYNNRYEYFHPTV